MSRQVRIFVRVFLSNLSLLAAIVGGGSAQSNDTFSFNWDTGNSPIVFNLTVAYGIENLGAWYRNPVLGFICSVNGQTYVVGPENPELCVDGVDVTLSSSLLGNVTVKFDADELDSFQSLNPDDPTQYVYGLPLSSFAVPNALYETIELNAITKQGATFSSLGYNFTVNYFNASASSLRAYYGVDPALQGTEQTRQGSLMNFGLSFATVNATAVNDYLSLQGLVPNNPLQFAEWAPPNNVSVCLLPGAECDESMLDVQAQQSFAPQAVTFFAPAVYAPLGEVRAALEQAGLTEAEIEQQLSILTSSDPSPSQLDARVLEVETALFRRYYVEYISNLTSAGNPPQVVSFSWAADLTSNGTIPYSFLEEGLKNLTMSGITVLVASGDEGASGDSSGGCNPAANPMTGNVDQDSWPVVSPWVTAVGGTQFLVTAVDGSTDEVVCNSATGADGITSGGGFAGPFYPSDLFSTPAWQKSAVQRYLAQNNATTFPGFPTVDVTPGYNPGGRAYPDISMYAGWFPILDLTGNLSVQSGTSLSAPMAAAIFTLANQELLASGYEVIGYANPMLYWMAESCPEAFNDITIGNNQATKGGSEDCLFGFPAAPGWDASTGLGSISFDPFVSCAKRYQDEVRSKGLELLPDGSYRPAASGGSAVTTPWPLLVVLLALVG